MATGKSPPNEITGPRLEARMTPGQSEALVRSLWFLFVLGSVIVDLVYRARGGKKPTKQDKKYFRLAHSLWIALMVVGGLRIGFNTTFEADMVTLFVMGPLAVWEWSRWRVRRRNPVTKLRP